MRPSADVKLVLFIFFFGSCCLHPVLLSPSNYYPNILNLTARQPALVPA